MRKLGRCGRQRRLKQKDSHQSCISQSHDPTFVAVKKWMKNVSPRRLARNLNNILEPAIFKDSGRGLRTTCNIKAGQTIVSIPANLLITTATVFNSAIGSLILREKYAFTPQQLLTVFLVIENFARARSLWSAYLNTLPEVYSTPLYYTDAEIELLAPRAKALAILARNRFVRSSQGIFTFMKERAPSFESMFTESAVRWAWSTVNTRSVYLQTVPHPLVVLDPEESNVALAPYLDLLNHKDTAQTQAGLNPETGDYEIITFDDYSKHHQVFICYGAHDNVKLLTNYGFTLPGNIHDCFIFPLDALIATCCHMDSANLKRRKSSIIEESQLSKNLVCGVDGISWSLLTALKILTLSWEQLVQWKNLMQGIRICETNDIRAEQMAKKLIFDHLHEAKRHLHCVDRSEISNHHGLLRSLAEADVRILEHSLSLLPDR